MNFLKKFQNYNVNYTLLALFISILIVGLIMLFSSSIIIADKKFGDKYYLIKHQLFYGIIPALVIFFSFSLINYKFIKKFYLVVFGASLVLLVLVLIPGIGQIHGGARSWIDLGPISFQPAEIMKLSLIIFLAAVFEKLGKEIKDFKSGFVPYMIVFSVIAFLLLLQPDLGTLTILYVISLSVYLIAGARKRHVLSLLAASFLVLFVFLKVDGGVRTMRIDIFLHPEKYSNKDEGYHVNQAMIAVGTGGVFGKGIGKSIQKFSYLPEVIADSIFAVIAEELGFILTTGFLALYFFFLYNSLIVAKNAPDAFSKYIVVGVVAWMGFQVFVNIGAMLRLMPLTGVPLPLVSYGSTSMWVLAAACGMVLNISRYSKSNDSSLGSIERKSKVIVRSKE